MTLQKNTTSDIIIDTVSEQTNGLALMCRSRTKNDEAEMGDGLLELSQRALAQLEEFHRENVFALLNSIVAPEPNIDQVIELARALDELIDLGLVVMGYREFRGEDERLAKTDSQKIISDLHKWFRFDTGRSVWTLKGGDIRSARIPETILTALGVERARSLLTARGHEWWRSIRAPL